ncbi:RNA polymerase sigma24 factor [Actinoplanes cyaneus]|uniref:RNA polymerase sigma24 factor n=1 Tax=Actinoplanes cyaneus TaxID=52696 RepID=A0A919IRI5_9ACTN|nr:SigE family RNA polymerase sigma factor [Actinoplanes cyaneus]MCW2140782.1 RNA polymerase sigma-70 factor, sigma-E family [Actinoplanes cyaneus]GID70128.1 RNA polymerase sigma24 factor [Actinoplanes cyaneus]
MTSSDAEFLEFAEAARLPLVRTARLLTGDWHLGQDLLQVTMMKVYLRWGRADRWDSPVTYARTVMVNTYCTWYRRRWRHEVPSERLPDNADAGDAAESVVTTDVLARALAGLPRRQRAAVVLRYYDDLPVEQVAAILGCPPGTVTSLTHRALIRLRRSPELLDDMAGER